MKPIRVYVAGPISHGDTYKSGRRFDNCVAGIKVAEKLWKLGYTPYCPHNSYWYGLICPHSYEEWLHHDFQWILQCDALLRMPGKSFGADQEVEFAKKNNIPVFHSIEKLKKELPSED
jgi:hypothetical protein